MKCVWVPRGEPSISHLHSRRHRVRREGGWAAHADVVAEEEAKPIISEQELPAAVNEDVAAAQRLVHNVLLVQVAQTCRGYGQ